MQRKIKPLIAVVLFAGVVPIASALNLPSRVPGSDACVKSVKYIVNARIPLDVPLRDHVMIEFDAGETVVGLHLNDDYWQEGAIGNTLALMPNKPYTKRTNVTVITEKGSDSRRYQFTMQSVRSSRSRNLTCWLSFKYPEGPKKAAPTPDKVKYAGLPVGIAPGQKVNRDYLVAGNADFEPVEIYDNGEWTYLKLKEGAPVPSFFAVDNNRRESSLNPMIRNGFAIIQRRVDRLSLKRGKEYICIKRKGLPDLGPSVLDVSQSHGYREGGES